MDVPSKLIPAINDVINEDQVGFMKNRQISDKMESSYAYGIPRSFIHTVKALYSNATTKTIINGTCSTTFPITRGVRQGDPLSSNIKGFTARVSHQDIHSFIVSLFADDTTVFLSQDDDYHQLENTLLTGWHA